MTREEAIKILKALNLMMHRPDGTPVSDGCEAIDMAIEALTQDSRKVTQESTQDIISRTDAIEAVENEMSEAWTESDADINRGMEYALSIINALPSAEAVQGWIPCSERLPEKDKLVLVTVWNDVSVAWRNIYGGWESAEYMYEKGDVTAWMPLPEPYKGGDAE